VREAARRVKLAVDDSALADLEDIYDWIAKDNVPQGGEGLR